MFGLGFNRNITLHNLGGAVGAGTTITKQDPIHAIPKSNNLCQAKSRATRNMECLCANN